MRKKLLALLLAALMTCSVFAGCKKTTEVIISGDDTDTTTADGADPDDPDTDVTDEDGNTKVTKSKKGKTTSTKKGKTTSTKTKKTRTTKPGDKFKYTPVADSGADYSVKGTVKVAVDTVRPTDFQAMFEVMGDLYPNVEIKLDRWTHSSNDDGREYLVKNMKTGTAADIMWDEAGEMPRYIKEGWVRPITKYVNADPEAGNLPANLRADYTFGGALFAVPHQATFELVAVNTTLYEKLGGKASDLEKYRNHPWSWDQYCALLQMGTAGFEQGLCVGIEDLFETHNRFAWYQTSDSSKKYSGLGFNMDTYQYEDGIFQAGTKEFRRLREIRGVEGWVSGQNGLLKSQLNYTTSYSGLWKAGKALVEDTLTVYVDKWNNLKFNYVTMPTPSKNGNLMMHIDQCFITSNCSDANMPAAFQLLRFMTYSTNGNLARLSMYEKENAKKFNLNSHIYYPTTNSQAVIDKFNSLEVVNTTDKYLLANLKNSKRYDAFKIVADVRDNRDTAKIGTAMNAITDGKDPSASGLNEPISKFNQLSVQSQKDFLAKIEELKRTKASWF